MTVSPLDMVTPAQPPTYGVRELLFFTVLTAAAYVAGALAVVVIHVVT